MMSVGGLLLKCPPLDAATDTPEKPRLFGGCLKWKTVMDDFFHGQSV
jgi:hypothetical protein